MDGNSGDGRGGRWARECDSCRSAACVVYCQADMAYLCTSCDWRVHAANRVASRHDRVWVCEACERSPAAVTCKADAAVLCTVCDADIHSVNPLARRHHRVPILPITGGVFGPRAAHLGSRMMMVGSDGGKEDRCAAREVDEEDAASWLVLNGVKKSSDERNEYVGGGEVDEYLDLVDYNGNYNYNYNSCGEDQYYNQQQQQQQKKKKGGRNEGSEGVVPVKCVEDKEQLQLQQNVQLEFEVSNSAFSYTASVTHSVSMSEASLVPDTTMTDISNSHNRPPKGTIDLFLGNPVHMAPQFTPMDREARVLRYREKKKTRKFEKTIRYASRKAYAETRPRIKGRFAKRTDVEIEADQMFSASVMAESGYSIISLF